MKIISLIVKEFKHNIRNKMEMIIMILTPILCILILGAAFGGTGNKINFKDKEIAYYIEKEDTFSRDH
ncbi:hypothetical protein HAHI6034_13030 [Hathewaya histolytica]|uniref:Uncharacterized protein n=1 Tax=Hathewaya histolytica TaxID=1498 RepID=A0A4V6Z167_HATHI|nr:hypothetical protein [Hathewaya histolytica]VTQ86027.1 Uncharacterised protein [Hathewaya histolytica]